MTRANPLTGSFPTVTTEGALLPSELLARIAAGDRALDGLDEASYGLSTGDRFGEAITRSWNRLIAAWAALQAARAELLEGDPGTTPTRERWLLPLFEELGYGRLPAAHSPEAGGRPFPISHLTGNSPVHLVGCRVPLDRRTRAVVGAATQSPHGLVQEFLNASSAHLWGFASNGLALRVLRDNATLTRQAYLEFDLESMMEGEQYADFALLWLICHTSRVAGAKPEECWLERWAKVAADQGRRALDELGAGVRTAIEALGHGFLAHPSNEVLKEALRSGSLDRQDYYRELLRLAYRLIFVFAAEDRGLLLDPAADVTAKERYARFYSTARLRRLAERRRGTRHGDLWVSLRVVFGALGRDDGALGLGLPALGGFLFGPEACPRLDAAQLANTDLLDAVRALGMVREGRARRVVDYRNIGSEELGSVYESLLELHPQVHLESARFVLGSAAGNERKTTGSYYTPTSLITCLLDSALDPVVEEAVRGKDRDAAEQAILALAVVDPAAGSGHFLVAAAHRLAKRLAAIRTGEGEPAPATIRHALRDVIAHCIYAVDVNPMAVELCKFSLWLEALEPGRPLSFLDAHIKVGNSLLGATPDLATAGIPDDAYEAIAGDDKTIARAWRARNKQEREGQQALFEAPLAIPTEALAREVRFLDALPEETPEAVAAKAARHASLIASADYRRARCALDAWCTAFVAPKTSGATEVTTAVVRAIGTNPGAVPSAVADLIDSTAAEYAFFHWPIEFAAVLERGGFDVVVGNPPWERVKLQEKEFFAERSPAIAAARNAAERKRMIVALQVTDPPLWQSFQGALRRSDGESHLLRNSGRYPLAGRGDINTYAVFAELMRSVISPRGRQGVILPTGIATDDTTKFFFGDLVERRALVSLLSFENEEFVFPAIHHATKFCLLTVAGSVRREPADLVFFARQVADLADTDRHFALTPEDFALLNPNTRTCPTFRTKRDAELTKAVYRRLPVLLDETNDSSGWNLNYLRMIDITNDAGLFRDHPGPDRLPLFEGKMVWHFDHRFGTYDGQTAEQHRQGKLPETTDEWHGDPANETMPAYWIDAPAVPDRLGTRWRHEWLLGFRNISNSVVARTMISSLIPYAAVANSFPLMLPDCPVASVAVLYANLVSFALDYVVRQKVGGTNMNFFIVNQLPVVPVDLVLAKVPWDQSTALGDWTRRRVIELAATSWSMVPFAKEAGWAGPPFRWDAARRNLVRAELDAAFFHLYGLSPGDVEHVMDSFWIIREREEKAFGSYRTKDLILRTYDMMAGATSDSPFISQLDPPPGDPRAAHPPRQGEAMGHWVPWSEVVARPNELGSESPTGMSRPFRSGAAPRTSDREVPPRPYPVPAAQPGAVPLRRVAEDHERGSGSTPAASRRSFASEARSLTASAAQPTLDDLSRAVSEPHGWIGENAVDPSDVQPGWQARHRSFGEGLVVWARVQCRSVSYVIRFSSGDHEIATGYGLLELRPPQENMG